MTLTLYITPHCGACIKVEKDLTNIAAANSDISLSVFDINKKRPPHIVIVPALFLDNELYCYGEFDTSKLLQRLRNGAPC